MPEEPGEKFEAKRSAEERGAGAASGSQRAPAPRSPTQTRRQRGPRKRTRCVRPPTPTRERWGADPGAERPREDENTRKHGRKHVPSPDPQSPRPRDARVRTKTPGAPAHAHGHPAQPLSPGSSLPRSGPPGRGCSRPVREKLRGLGGTQPRPMPPARRTLGELRSGLRALAAASIPLPLRPGLTPTWKAARLPPRRAHGGGGAWALGPALFSARPAPRSPLPGPLPAPRCPAPSDGWSRRPGGSGSVAKVPVWPGARSAPPPPEPGSHPRERLKSAQLPPTPPGLAPSFLHPCSPPPPPERRSNFSRWPHGREHLEVAEVCMPVCVERKSCW